MQRSPLSSIGTIPAWEARERLMEFSMRKLVLTAASAALAIGLAAPAMAQDAQGPFTGARVEGVLGYDSISDGHDQSSSSSDGVTYGGAFGYDWQVGRLIVGAEGEITGSTTDTRTDNLIANGDSYRMDAGRDLYAGVRVGAAISPVAMVYAKGGYTNARVNEEYRLGSTRTEDHTDLDGFRVGAGIEYKTSANTYVKGEYRYSNYSGGDNVYDVDVDRHQVVAGVGLRF